MSKIIQLDKNLANQIAAGEVVERPVSVIKELIENSIDAGCENIKIEVIGGGIESIIVHDDGVGIAKEDLPKVVEKYSTSKIRSLEDLHKVLTFGFRGEAMASISSVSDMKILSKSADDMYAYELSIEAGNMGEIKKSAGDTGTKIQVDNLFYNTPARLNYLKSSKTEYNHIYKYIQEIALAYPNIGFEFLSDGKQVCKYKGNNSQKTRIYEIYGQEVYDNLLGVEFEMNTMQVSGYISNPTISFPNRNRQVLFVNKRPIKSPLIIKAISDAYNRFIPHGTYPVYILNLEIDPTLVDVNVHPRKLEVRFAQEQSIFRIFYHALEEKLQNISLVEHKTDSYSNNTAKMYQSNDTKINKGEDLGRQNRHYYTPSGTKFQSYSPYKNTDFNPNQSQINESLDFSKTLLQVDNSDKNTFSHSNDIYQTRLGKIIGQIHNAYILVETESGIQILDQHAVAERVIYEKLMKQERKDLTQGLLIGEHIQVVPHEIDIIQNYESIFSEMGFDLEILPGNMIMIHGIPNFIKKEDIKKIFLGILEDMSKGNIDKSKTLAEVKNKIYAYTSCRSAIKFGHKLSVFEMNKLLEDASIEYSSTCPHGRPVAYEISLDELKGKYER